VILGGVPETRQLLKERFDSLLPGMLPCDIGRGTRNKTAA